MRSAGILLCAFLLAGCGEVWSESLDDPDAPGGKADDTSSGTLGFGDEVLDKETRAVLAAYSPTPENVVLVALHELHRGDERTLEDVLADQAVTRVSRGAKAGKEGRAAGSTKGNNWDAKGFQVISHVGEKALGPIGTYLNSVGFTTGNPWCGAFATFVYRRAGIKFSSVAATRRIPGVLASSGDETAPGQYFRLTGKEIDGSYYRGTLEQGAHDDDPVFSPLEVASLKSVDIRPGDLLWWEHKDGTGHAGIAIGVVREANEIRIVSVEGNVSDRLQARMHAVYRDDDGTLTADFKGWGRPAELVLAVQPDLDSEPAWMKAAAEVLPVFDVVDDR